MTPSHNLTDSQDVAAVFDESALFSSKEYARLGLSTLEDPVVFSRLWGWLLVDCPLDDGVLRLRVSSARFVGLRCSLVGGVEMSNGQRLHRAALTALPLLLAFVLASLGAPLGWCVGGGAAAAVVVPMVVGGLVEASIERDCYAFHPDSALARLLALWHAGQDDGLVARMREAGWTWEILDTDEALDLVLQARQALRTARQAGIDSAESDVPAIVAGCTCSDDVTAAQEALAELQATLDEAHAAHARFDALVDAPHREALDEVRTAARTHARERARSVVAYTRQVAAEETRVHEDLVREWGARDV